MTDYRTRLIAAREKLGLTRTEMAGWMLTPRVTYTQWEDGSRRTPGIAVAAAELAVIAKQRRKFSLRARVLKPADVLPLLDGTRTIAEIAQTLGATRNAIEKHIRKMRKRGLKVSYRHVYRNGSDA